LIWPLGVIYFLSGSATRAGISGRLIAQPDFFSKPYLIFY